MPPLPSRSIPLDNQSRAIHLIHCIGGLVVKSVVSSNAKSMGPEFDSRSMQVVPLCLSSTFLILANMQNSCTLESSGRKSSYAAFEFEIVGNELFHREQKVLSAGGQHFNVMPCLSSCSLTSNMTCEPMNNAVQAPNIYTIPDKGQLASLCLLTSSWQGLPTPETYQTSFPPNP